MPGIHYPDPAEGHALNELNFVVYGTAQPVVRFVKGFATHYQGGVAQRTYRGHTIVQPHTNPARYWVIQFLLEDELTIQLGDSFNLKVKAEDLPQGVQVPDLTKNGVQHVAGAGLSMTFPTNGASICPQFSAYGTSDQTPDVTGFLTTSNGLQANATKTVGPPNWVLTCSIPSGGVRPFTFTANQNDDNGNPLPPQQAAGLIKGTCV